MTKFDALSIRNVHAVSASSSMLIAERGLGTKNGNEVALLPSRIYETEEEMRKSARTSEFQNL
jgi:hypothetical protein